MSKGLVLARLFHRAGWTVIGADFSSLACGRFSRSLVKYYTVTKPDDRSGSANYIKDLFQIVRRHNVDLWVSCSSVASAVEDGEAKEAIEAETQCRAIQFDVVTTRMLHEKHTFLQRAASYGLTVPDTHVVTSHSFLESALREAPLQREYIIKPIGMDDANRGNMTLLSRGRIEETKRYSSSLVISKERPWILQQFIKGPEYCTHALVIRGHVKAFVACPSAELLMHYAVLPQEDELCRAMLQFTTTFAANEGAHFTGHLSFDFMVKQKNKDEKEQEPRLYPIECNPRAHTAIALFQDQPELVDAYASCLSLSERPAATGTCLTIPRSDCRPVFWSGHDLVELLLQPVWNAMLGRTSTGSAKGYVNNVKKFVKHISYWQDGTYEYWDPLPWWWYAHSFPLSISHVSLTVDRQFQALPHLLAISIR